MTNEELLQAISVMIERTLEEKLEEKLEVKLEEKFAKELAPIRADIAQIKSTMVTKDDLAESENMILNELSNTHNIMIARTDALKAELQEVKSRVSSLESDKAMLSTVIDTMVQIDKRVTELERKTA